MTARQTIVDVHGVRHWVRFPLAATYGGVVPTCCEVSVLTKVNDARIEQDSPGKVVTCMACVANGRTLRVTGGV